MKKTSKILLLIVSFMIVFCVFSNNFVYAIDPDLTTKKTKEDTSKSSDTDWTVTEEFNAEDWDPRLIRTETRRF